ncbi:MAG: ABC transporter ATP-binding protein [Bacilli bacterium]|jgi:ATP-binding cassette subfamily B multidrug efflux pump
MFKGLLSNIGKYKKYAILTPIMMVFEVLFEVAIPFVMALIIDKGIAIGVEQGNMSYVIEMGGLLILFALIALLCGFFGGRFGALASTGLAKELRRKLFYKIQDFSFSNVDKFQTSSLITRMTIDVNMVQNAFMMSLRMLVRAPIMLTSATIMAFIINARLATVFIIVIPFLAFFLYLIFTKAHPYFRIMLNKYDTLNNSIQENLIGIRVVKSFVREDYEIEKFKKSVKELKDTSMSAEKIVILSSPVMQFTMYISIIVIAWFGAKLIITNLMQTGELMSFITYITLVLMSLMMLSMTFIQIIISRAASSRIVEVLQEEVEIKDGEDVDLRVKDGSIEYRDVCFSYVKNSENYVLKNINLKIKSGEVIGILGGTGSAKTTLVQLIPRLYDVSKGELIVGKMNVKNYSLRNLRKDVGIVLQKNVLFSGTIKENLLWGNVNATNEEIEEVCKVVQAHDFIMSFPEGYDMFLEQGGTNLSGGQKQRLCIARALIANPKILILDDATSAIDTNTEAKIRVALKEKLKDTTVIIIAQRVNSVDGADKVLILDEGEIDAFDTPKNLLANNKIYQDLYFSQLKGGE